MISPLPEIPAKHSRPAAAASAASASPSLLFYCSSRPALRRVSSCSVGLAAFHTLMQAIAHTCTMTRYCASYGRLESSESLPSSPSPSDLQASHEALLTNCLLPPALSSREEGGGGRRAGGSGAGGGVGGRRGDRAERMEACRAMAVEEWQSDAGGVRGGGGQQGGGIRGRCENEESH